MQTLPFPPMRAVSRTLFSHLTVFSVLVLGYAGLIQAQTVVLEPVEVFIEDPDAPIRIDLRTGSGPVTADDIRAVRLLVDGEEYRTGENITYQLEDGTVVLSPIPGLSEGRYTLQLESPDKVRQVTIYRAPATRARDLNAQAALLEISERELREELGLTEELRETKTKLNLSPVYYQGQTVVAEMQIADNHYYSWKVNGKEIAYGQGDHTFVYTFKAPGANVVTYYERDGEQLYTSGIQSVDVVPRPGLMRREIAGSPVRIEGPAGYASYVWKVDGEVVGTSQTLEHTFLSAGNHQIEVVAQEPSVTPGDEYRAVSYNFEIDAP